MDTSDQNSTSLTTATLKNLLLEQTADLIKKIDESKQVLKEDILQSEQKVIAHVEKKIEDVNLNVDELKAKLAAQDEELKMLKKEIDTEKRSRNLILYKVAETETSKKELFEKIIKLIYDQTNVDISNNIDKMFRLGKANPNRMRPILISLTSLGKKIDVFMGIKEHKSSIEISDDYSPEVLQERKRLVPILKKLKEMNYNNVRLRQDKLYVEGELCDEKKWRSLIHLEPSTSDKCGLESVNPSAPLETSSQSILNQTISKRTREECSPERSSKIIKESPINGSQNIVTKTKTTIIGINNYNKTSANNPIKNALKKQFLKTQKPEQ